MMRWSKINTAMLELQCLKWINGTNPAGLTLCPLEMFGTRRPGVPTPAWRQQVSLPLGDPRRVALANLGRIVLESILETLEMNRAYAFWFSFYDFPQPLAEGLS